MTAKQSYFTVSTNGFDDIIDITSKVFESVIDKDVQSGIINISVMSSVASLKVLENEPGLIKDLLNIMSNQIPVNKIYQHDEIWHDGNANSHLKTAFMGTSLTLPIINGKVGINENQHIVLIDFDNKPSEKKLVTTIIF